MRSGGMGARTQNGPCTTKTFVVTHGWEGGEKDI